jgi:HAD superfamily hydrolase (TIGR01509 family)
VAARPVAGSKHMGDGSAIIFDCDGVLVDSEPIANRVMVELLNEHGYSITMEESVARFVGKTLQTEIEMFRAEGRSDLGEIIGRELVPRTLRAFERELRAVDGIGSLLGRLDGRPRAVASGSTPDRLSLSLRLTGLAAHFGAHVYSSTLVPNPKPAPDLFLYAAERLGVSAGDCAVVEDSVGGVRAGVAAGMRVIGFTGGSHATPELGQRLREFGAEVVVSDTTTLGNVLGLPI